MQGIEKAAAPICGRDCPLTLGFDCGSHVFVSRPFDFDRLVRAINTRDKTNGDFGGTLKSGWVGSGAN